MILQFSSSAVFLIFLMRFLQTTVDAAMPNVRLICGGQTLHGTLQTDLQISNNGATFLPFNGDLCSAPDDQLQLSQQTVWFCDNCLVNCLSKVEKAPKGLLIVADVKAPNFKLSWFHIQTSVSSLKENNKQCNLNLDQPLTASNMEETSTDALRSFSKTSVLFVSISFIILMVISLAWLVFYYVQRFRYAHAKDRLQRRLFNAARKALARIPTRSVRSGDEELQTDCAVCLDPYQLHDIVRILPCKHVYHKSCIDPWLLEHRTCPMCKADILKYFGYQYYDAQCGRNDDMAGRVEIGERDRDRAILQADIVSPEVTSESSDSNGFSFDHSEHVESFAFTPSVPPQLVLNASNAKSFVMPMSGRVGSASSATTVIGGASSGSSSHHHHHHRHPQTSYSARGHRSGSHDNTQIPHRAIRTAHGSSSSGSAGGAGGGGGSTSTGSGGGSAGSQGQIVNLVQVKSRATSVTRSAATIRKESIGGGSGGQPTPIDVTSSAPQQATTTSSTQVV